MVYARLRRIFRFTKYQIKPKLVPIYYPKFHEDFKWWNRSTNKIMHLSPSIIKMEMHVCSTQSLFHQISIICNIIFVWFLFSAVNFRSKMPKWFFLFELWWYSNEVYWTIPSKYFISLKGNKQEGNKWILGSCMFEPRLQ